MSGVLKLDEAVEPQDLALSTKTRSLSPLGNSVVLILGTSKAKPSKSEKVHLAKVMDEVDALLLHPDSKAPYLGSLEGDDQVEGQCRLFLSCPSADDLVERLRPWLRTLDWRNSVSVLKRYGAYDDPDCREEYVALRTDERKTKKGRRGNRGD